MIQEFKKIGMNVMGISETKWFGLGMVWMISSFSILGVQCQEVTRG